LSGKGKKLKEITVNRYINLLGLPIIKKEEYYWVTNGYLYVTNPDVQAIRLVAFFEEDVPNEVLYPECGCNGNQNTNEQICMNPLDKVFNVPGYLEKQILDLTSQKLLTTYFKLKTDITDNGVDGQAPNTIPNS